MLPSKDHSLSRMNRSFSLLIVQNSEMFWNFWLSLFNFFPSFFFPFCMPLYWCFMYHNMSMKSTLGRLCCKYKNKLNHVNNTINVWTFSVTYTIILNKMCSIMHRYLAPENTKHMVVTRDRIVSHWLAWQLSRKHRSSHLQGREFRSCLWSVCRVCMFSPGFAGLPQQSTDDRLAAHLVCTPALGPVLLGTGSRPAYDLDYGGKLDVFRLTLWFTQFKIQGISVMILSVQPSVSIY